MTKLDEFVETMQKAFELASELCSDGINSIDWDLTYHGTPAATKEIQAKIYNAMKKAGMTTKGVA